MSIRFDDRVAIVTGAGQGLGRCYALYLAERGARVVINDLGGALDGAGSDASLADSVAAEIRAAGGGAVVSTDSVSDRDGAARIVQTALDTWGRADILINNAGILRDKMFTRMNMDDFEAVVAVHLLGTAYVTRAAFPVMRKQSYGRIVMTTSAAGLFGNLGQANYAAAKLGIVGLMNALKIEGKKTGVKVNAVAPVADTRMGARVYPDFFKRMIRPELVAAAVAYLASEQCQTSGDILVTAAGYFAKVQMVEAQGVTFEPDAEVTPEMVAERFGEITDMSAAVPHDTAMDAMKSLFAKVAPKDLVRA
ncbi:MAG: SDR family NAD(P)-dependent oxidoreductase [bacterium]|nr:SDR family NAD(P)-dependent oxidoreductase [bacterium]